MSKFRFNPVDLVPDDSQITSNPKIRKFFKKHGDYIQHRDQVIFHDGATVEITTDGFGMVWPPPKDRHERDKLICQYWECVARRAESEFNDFQHYLHGNGLCPPHIRSEEDKIEHLSVLKTKAKDARLKLRQAKKQEEESVPAWLVAKRRDAAEEAEEQEEFMSRVNKIQL
jgi:hypothetical protein